MFVIVLVTSTCLMVCFLILIIGSLCRKGNCCTGASPQADAGGEPHYINGHVSDGDSESGDARNSTSPPSGSMDANTHIYADVTKREERTTPPGEQPNRGYFSMEVLKVNPRGDRPEEAPPRCLSLQNHLYVNDVTPL